LANRQFSLLSGRGWSNATDKQFNLVLGRFGIPMVAVNSFEVAGTVIGAFSEYWFGGGVVCRGDVILCALWVERIRVAEGHGIIGFVSGR